jgi:hypothetical protein
MAVAGAEIVFFSNAMQALKMRRRCVGSQQYLLTTSWEVHQHNGTGMIGGINSKSEHFQETLLFLHSLKQHTLPLLLRVTMSLCNALLTMSDEPLVNSRAKPAMSTQEPHLLSQIHVHELPVRPSHSGRECIWTHCLRYATTCKPETTGTSQLDDEALQTETF